MSDILGHAATSAIIGAVVGGLVSWPVSYRVAMATIEPSQDRQLRLEQMAAFSQEADDFLSLGTKIVPRLNASAPIDSEKIAIADASGRQTIRTESLIGLFGPGIRPAAQEYQSALVKFVATTNELQSPAGIKVWVEAFDGVVVTQSRLKTGMFNALKIKPEMVSTAAL